jgi:hypothetical protein
MSSEEKEHKHHHDHGHHHHHHGHHHHHHYNYENRVTIGQAKLEIERWKQVNDDFKDKTPFGYVKAFFIPMEDIKQLCDDYGHLSPTGVRAYIGITDPDKNGDAPLRLLLVPATEEVDFYKNFPGHHHGHHHHHHGADATVNPGDSSIYDFTMPCPDACAEANELNTV